MRQFRGVQVNTKVIVDRNHPKLGDGHCHVYLFVEGDRTSSPLNFHCCCFLDQKKKTGVVERRVNCSRPKGLH